MNPQVPKNTYTRIQLRCMPKSYFLLFMLIFVFLGTPRMYAQHLANQHAEIIQDRRIDSLVNRQAILNDLKKTIPGYRVQIYSGPQRSKANEVKADFSGNFSDIPAYLVYQQPNFKIRTGNFRTKLEAYKFMKSLPYQFANSFIVNDEIVIPELDKK